MESAVYALIVNACVAALFAVTFAVIRLSYPDERDVNWFTLVYAIGGITPLSELGVRLTDFTTPFMVTSYGSFLVSIALMPVGLAALADRRKPWRAVMLLVASGVILRAAIWNGPRNELWYELAYQSPFIVAAAMATAIAVATVRRRRDPLWLVLAVICALMTTHFLTKPFFAAAFGSGMSARAYAGSVYALFSQATGGALIVVVGLVTLLLVVQSAMGRTIAASETDPLTAIANRRGFERRGDAMIDMARAAGQPLSAILFDLDHFKRVNDNYGHATGDAVLRAFAAMLVDRLPSSAAIARLGGEEFVVLLDRTTLRGAWLAAQSVRATLPAISTHLPPITISAGLSALEPDDTLATFVARADRFAYDAKRAGRNRICPVPEPVSAEPARIIRTG